MRSKETLAKGRSGYWRGAHPASCRGVPESEVTALVMHLPEDFDLIIGSAWLKERRARMDYGNGKGRL